MLCCWKLLANQWISARYFWLNPWLALQWRRRRFWPSLRTHQVSSTCSHQWSFTLGHLAELFFGKLNQKHVAIKSISKGYPRSSFGVPTASNSLIPWLLWLRRWLNVSMMKSLKPFIASFPISCKIMLLKCKYTPILDEQLRWETSSQIISLRPGNPGSPAHGRALRTRKLWHGTKTLW